MKSISQLLPVMVLAIFLQVVSGISNNMQAQCFISANPSSVFGGPIFPTSTWQVQTCVKGGEFYSFIGTVGQQYTFTFCNNGGSITWNSQLSINNSSFNAVLGEYNDDFCGVGSQLTFTPTTTSTYYVYITNFSCVSGNTCANLAFRSTGSGTPTPTAITVQTGGNYANPAWLVQNVFMTGCAQVSNITYQGHPSAIGYFSNGTSLGIPNGIILSTGNVAGAVGPNNTSGAATSFGLPGHPYLQNLLPGYNITDAAVLQFNFTPLTGSLQFQYIFASDEYPEWVGTSFNDAFGFFIQGPGLPLQNIALIPGTTLPVSVNNINNLSYGEYYVANPTNSVITQYDGFTTPLTATISGIIPCQTYTITLAIADAGDAILDSAVFLAANSFNAGTVVSVSAFVPSTGAQDAYEGCQDGYFTFTRGDLTGLSEPVSFNINVGGTATAGLDYEPLPTVITIPPGQVSVLVPVIAYTDFLSESTETIVVQIQEFQCDCSFPAPATISLFDNPPFFDVFIPPVPPVCPGEFELLSALASGSNATPYTYLWSNGSGSSFNWVSPTSNTLYIVTVTDACGRTAVASVIVAVDAGLPDATISPAGPFCVNENPVFLTAATPGGFWSGLGVQSATGLFNPALAYASGVGPYTISYTVSNGCGVATESISIQVNPSGVPVINPVAPLCAGSATGIILSATVPGGVWSGAGIVGGSNTSGQFSVSLALAGGPGPYLVSYTTLPPCGGTDTELIFINQPPAVSITGSPVVCAGSSTTLSASGGNAYTWSTGATSQSITVAPMATTTYTVTVTGASGCTASSGVTVFVNNISPPALTGGSVCLGSSFTLNAGSGYAAYLWSNGSNNQNILVTPNVTTNYTVTVTNASGCTASANTLVNVYANPLPIITGSFTFCPGSSATLTASSGFSNYAWSNGVQSTSITVSTPGIYTVTVTNSNGCTGSAQVTVTQNPQLNPVITGNTSPCPGQTSFLDAGNGYAQYSWSNGATTQVINAPPGSYTVTVTSANGCTGTASANVAPLPAPVVSITGNTNICAGSSATLTATSGFVQYVWSNGTLGSLLTVNTAGTYSVTVTNAQGCTASASVAVSIIPVTPPSISPVAICIGESATLQASDGYSSYIWSNGTTGAINTVSPTSNTQYTVTVTTAEGCTASASVAVTVFAATPPNMPAVAMCLGTGATLNAGAGYNTYLWSTGQTTQTIAVNPNSSTTYSVTVTNLQGCSATATATVIVNVATAPGISPASICSGGSTILNAGAGYLSYQWSNGATTQSTTVSPAETTLYTVTVTDVLGCSATGTVWVTVVALPPPALSNIAICLGNSATLNAGAGYSSYAWSTDVGGQTIVVSPATTTTYAVTVTNSQGCTASTGSTVTVNSLPLADAGQNQSICLGQSATLSATGGASYLWSNGQTGQTVTVMPAATTNYTVTATSAAGCNATDMVSVEVFQALSISGIVGEEPNITCFDNGEYAVSFVVNGGALPYMVNGNAFANSYTVQNLTAPTYAITVSDAQGCVNILSGDNSFCNVSCAVQASIIPVYNGSCPDGFEVVVQSGPPQPPAYMYGISPDNMQFSPVFTGLSEGEYTVYISTGCGVDSLGNFNQPANALVVSVIVEQVGQIYVATASPAGGNTPYTYQWSNGSTSNPTEWNVTSFVGSVTVTDLAGCTKAVNFNQSGVVGTESPDVPVMGFELYPNPAADRFVVAASSPFAQPAQVLLYNLQGQLAYQTQSHFSQPLTINVTHLPAGLYVLHLIADERFYSYKVWCGNGSR